VSRAQGQQAGLSLLQLRALKGGQRPIDLLHIPAFDGQKLPGLDFGVMALELCAR
jgi:hypothetical protein